MKLTNHLRDRIVRRLLEHAFGAKRGAMKAEESALFTRAMRDAYGGDVLDRIATLPREWFATTGYLWTSANGMRVGLRGEEVAVPRCGPEDDVIRDAALAAEVLDWMNRHELHAEREKTLERKLRAVAYAASTVKQFFDAMPEAREILAGIVADNAPRTDVAVIAADVWRDLEAARKQEAEA